MGARTIIRQAWVSLPLVSVCQVRWGGMCCTFGKCLVRWRLLRVTPFYPESPPNLAPTSLHVSSVYTRHLTASTSAPCVPSLTRGLPRCANGLQVPFIQRLPTIIPTDLSEILTDGLTYFLCLVSVETATKRRQLSLPHQVCLGLHRRPWRRLDPKNLE